MKTKIKRQAKDRPSSRLDAAAPFSKAVITPVLAGFYYAISDESSQGFSIVQVVEAPTITQPTRIKLRQFAPTYKALPDFLIPEQLGSSVAQFWLALDDFMEWQPLLMQRGGVDSSLYSQKEAANEYF